jgi:hypothetical protein
VIRRPSISLLALLPDTFQALLRLSPDSLKDSLSALDPFQQRSLLERFAKAQAGGPRGVDAAPSPSDPSWQRSLRYPSLPWTASGSESCRRCPYVRTNLTLECLIARVNLLLDRPGDLNA